MIKTTRKRGQISLEYLIVTGFVMIIILGILGVAMFYSNSIKDSLTIYNLNNFGEKVTSSAASVFYSGYPSKATITTYLPEGVQSIQIIENSILVSISTASGVAVIAYSSDVPIYGNISLTGGVKTIQLSAETDKVSITSN